MLFGLFKVKATRKRDYVTEIDAFYHQFFEKRQSFGDAYHREKKKHHAIAQKRDYPHPLSENRIWDDF